VITREDALLLIGKLCECKRVRGRIGFPFFGLWIEGKLRRDGEWLFLELPGLTLDCRLTEDMEFEFIEAVDVFGSRPTEDVVSGLGIALPTREKIILLEIKD
jgi:hypothetical protein